MFDTEVTQLRHKLRGHVHALSLCTTVLGRGTTPDEDAQFLTDIIEAATQIPSLLDRLDELQPPDPPPAADPAPYAPSPLP